jgi:hypothetical protein
LGTDVYRGDWFEGAGGAHGLDDGTAPEGLDFAAGDGVMPFFRGKKNMTPVLPLKIPGGISGNLFFGRPYRDAYL